ncbi:Uma2 family endonuclease [Nocardia sp. IFM 10818]
MHLVDIPVRPGNLREAAEAIERSTGMKVQIIGGTLVMSPTPRGKHAGTILEMKDQIDPTIRPALRAFENSSILMPGSADDYSTPDLTVLPKEWAADDEWLADPADVALAIEVISTSERAKTILDKTNWYAAAGVTTLLNIDPRNGNWTLYTRPREGEYQGVLNGKYGDDIPLPPPLPTLKTAGLPIYS